MVGFGTASRLLSAAVLLAISTSSAYAQGTPNQNFVVDCNKGHSIQEAVDKARENSEIFISGNCFQSVVVSTDRIRLIAVDGATLAPSAGHGNPLTIHGDNAVVRDFASIKGGTGNVITVKRGGSAFIYNNVIEQGGFGIILQNGSSARVIDNTIQDNNKGILVAGASSAFIRGGTVKNSISDGIQVFGGSDAVIDGVDVIMNGGSGINITSGSADVSRNFVSDNGGVGISVSGSGYGNLNDNRVENSRASGVWIARSSYAEVVDNNITGSFHHGIGVAHASSATIYGNTSSFNGISGIEVGQNSAIVVSPSYAPAVNTLEGNYHWGLLCGFSGAIDIDNDQNYGSGNTSGNEFFDDACDVRDSR